VLECDFEEMDLILPLCNVRFVKESRTLSTLVQSLDESSSGGFVDVGNDKSYASVMKCFSEVLPEARSTA